jgi:hypothetical protein
LSLGTKGLKPRQQSVCNQGSVSGGGWRGQMADTTVVFRVKVTLDRIAASNTTKIGSSKLDE